MVNNDDDRVSYAATGNNSRSGVRLSLDDRGKGKSALGSDGAWLWQWL
jgi:hypothetical protein